MTNSQDVDQNTEDFYEEKAVEEEKKRFISFTLSGESYAVSIDNTKEIVNAPFVTHVPGAAGHISGIINLRGNILSVTDLGKIFNLPAESKIAQERKIIVIEAEGKETGLLVDSVNDALDIPVSKIDPPMATLSGSAADYIEGESQIDGKLIGILKADKLIK